MQIFRREEDIKNKTGKPTRISVVNPDAIKAAKHTFFVTVNQKQKKNSDMAKVLFNEMMQEAKQFPNINMDYLSERFAVVWGENPMKMFKKMSDVPSEDVDNSGTGQNGARGKMISKSMTQAGKPRATKVNATV